MLLNLENSRLARPNSLSSRRDLPHDDGVHRPFTTPVSTITAVGVFIWTMWCGSMADDAQHHHYTPEVVVALLLALPLAYGVVRLQVAPLNGATKASTVFAGLLGVLLVAVEVIGPLSIGLDRWSEVIGALAGFAVFSFAWRNVQALRDQAQMA